MKSWVEHTISGEIEISHTHCIELSAELCDRFIRNYMLVDIVAVICEYLEEKGYEIVSAWNDDKGNHYIKWIDDEYLNNNEELLEVLKTYSNGGKSK